MSDKPKRRKKVSTPTRTVERDAAPIETAAPKVEAHSGVEIVYVDTPVSLARRKRDLINELRSATVTPARQIEIRTIIDGELADVPILSHQEISRLGA